MLNNLNDLSNPGMAVSFISLLPPFGAPGAGGLAGMLMLGVLVALMTFAWPAAYSTVVAHVGGALRQGRPRRRVDAIAGSALIGLSLRTAAEHA